MALHHLFRHQRDDVAIDVELAKVDGGNAVLLGKELSEVVLLDRAYFDKRVSQAFARLLALFLCTL